MEQSLYIQLSEKLIEKINEMEVGELLPSERKLAEIYGVSRTTVRLALDHLEVRGYILRQHGRGSIVVDYHKSLINLSEMYSFTEQMKALGQEPSTKLIGHSIINTNEKLEKIFLNGEQKFIKLIRLRSSDGIPLMYEESFIPFSKFQDIKIKDIEKRSLYGIFKEDFNEVVKLAQEEFSADLVNEEVARQLDISPDSAVLQIYRTTINIKNETIEYTESKADPSKFSYRTVHHNHIEY